MSRFITVLIGSMLLPSTIALGLDAPEKDQDLDRWDWLWETHDYDGDGTDDTPQGTDLTGNLWPDLTADCGTDYPNPMNQPKPPEGCGDFASDDGGEGFYIYYDPSGLPGSSPWRNRLLVRYLHANVVYRGQFKNNGQSQQASECPLDQNVCTGGVKFCGTMRYRVSATEEYFGDFNFCSQASSP